MHDRLELNALLEKILGSTNVYYQPPESIKIKYPAIIYNKQKPDVRSANNADYLKTRSYELIYISNTPDDSVIDNLERLPMCEWIRHYVADNLHHDILNIFF